MKYRYVIMVFMFFLISAGCFSSHTVSPVAADEINTEIVSSSTDLGIKVFQKLREENSGENIFISPSSIVFALYMTYNGSEGKTKEDMAKTLEVSGINLEELNQSAKLLMNYLEQNDEKVKLAIANSLWCSPRIEFREDFIKRCKDSYSAEVRNELDVDVINGWMTEKTEGKIEKVLDEVPPDALLYLINAIYFKGIWQTEFDKEKTEELDFHLADGSVKKHPLMSQTGEYNYYRGDKFQALSLPYGEGKFSMYVFLPDEDSSLEDFCKNLTAENLEEWISLFHMTEGDILLPRFKVEYKSLLNDTLKALGMEIAFEKNADFSGMSSFPLFISKVIHQTFVEVNEEGTEAAAVTVVEMVAGGPPPEEPTRFYMKVDRPFFFCIRDNETGTLLFMGSINEP